MEGRPQGGLNGSRLRRRHRQFDFLGVGVVRHEVFGEPLEEEVAVAREVEPAEHEERAIYLLEGELEIDGVRLGERQMAVLRPGGSVTARAMPVVFQ